MFRSLGNKAKLVDRVVSEIQEQITRGQIQPGNLLPSERELGEQLGVSRTVIREAVRMLSVKGLLVTKPGVGTIVTDVTSQQITEPLLFIISKDGEHRSLDHLYEARKILEVSIARLAAERATEEDIERLTGIFASMQDLIDDTDAFASKDAEFHNVITETTHNPLLIILMESIHNLLQNVRTLVMSYDYLTQLVLPEHKQILDMIKLHDVEGAAQAMSNHIDTSRRIQAEYLENIKTPI